MGKSKDELLEIVRRHAGQPPGIATPEEQTAADEAVKLLRILDDIQHAAATLDEARLATFLPLLPALRDAAGPLLSKKLEEIIHKAHARRSALKGLDEKKDIAKKINAECRAYGFAIAHPDTGEPCTLLFVNDRTGGRFTLENRLTKKRSHTTPTLERLLPIKLVALTSSGE